MPSRIVKVVASLSTGGLMVAALAAGPGAGAAAGRARGLIAHLENSSGGSVGRARFVRADDGAVRVRLVAWGLTPGFHGFHVHSTGVCDPEARDATGATVPFFSAGGHYNSDASRTHGAHAGDMPPLLAMENGRALLRFKTDRFLLRELMDEDGSAVIVHAGADNLANIPATTPSGAERYHSHVDNILGPDTATKATGDAGARFACGVVDRPDS